MKVLTDQGSMHCWNRRGQLIGHYRFQSKLHDKIGTELRFMFRSGLEYYGRK